MGRGSRSTSTSEITTKKSFGYFKNIGSITWDLGFLKYQIHIELGLKVTK